MKDKIDERTAGLEARLERLNALEQEVRQKEKALKAKESSRKQIVLRLAPGLWEEISAWADEDFRSINGQIEYLLTECVNRRKKGR